MSPDGVFQKDICWPIWILGLLGYLLLSWFALNGATKGERGIPAKLETAAQTALDRAGIPWAQVEADGQAIILTGAAPNKAAQKLAANVVKNSVGPGGFFRGGVTKVRNKMTIGAAAPVTVRWLAKKRPDGALVLSGLAPSVIDRTDLVRQARSLVPAEIVDSMKASANPPDVNWLPMARLGLTLIAQMSDGEAEISGNRLIVRGTAANEAFSQSALRQLKALPKPFLGESAISVKMDIPELGGAQLAVDERSITNCQDAFNKITSAKTINFDTGTAVLGANNEATLDQIAYVAKRCSHFRIEVMGHTDSSGSRIANLALSKARADAVVAYLVSQGVSSQRLSSQGFGPDKPIAHGDTPAAMAKNRRINFNVQPDGAQ